MRYRNLVLTPTDISRFLSMTQFFIDKTEGDESFCHLC